MRASGRSLHLVCERPAHRAKRARRSHSKRLCFSFRRAYDLGSSTLESPKNCDEVARIVSHLRPVSVYYNLHLALPKPRMMIVRCLPLRANEQLFLDSEICAAARVDRDFGDAALHSPRALDVLLLLFRPGPQKTRTE
nr:hypothetical protein CFP56_57583 [Quercus suber]